MSSRRNEILARKEDILRITIDQYIRTVAPVSSALIAKKSTYNLSSATIRNILAELEQEGYLTHPHTSAGRVPTQFGYRYYVDHFINRIQLLEEEKARIKEEYDRETRQVEVLLQKTSRVLSNVTQYTSIISVDGQEDKLYCGGTSFLMTYPDYHDLTKDIRKIKNILAALEEKERLLEVINRDLAKNMEVLIGQEINCAEIDGCSLVLSRYQSRKGPSGRIAILGPTRMDYNRVMSTLDYFSKFVEEIL